MVRTKKEMRSKRYKLSSSKWKWILAVLAIIFVVGGVYGVMYWKDLNHSLEQANVKPDAPQGTTVVEKRELRAKKVSLSEGDPINILLLGTDDDGRGRDEAKGYVSRSDSMIVLSMNPKTRTTKMLSIPRDVYAFIQGQPGPDKINHAYAFGGVDLSMDTVQNFLNLPIDYYAVVNMQGLEQLVDAVGGVDITSPITFTYQESSFVAGETKHVDGWNAMNFARMRYDDPEGETGRQNRQKLVIKAIVDKIISGGGIVNLPQLLQVVAKNVKTNLDLKQAMDIYQKYSPALQNISAIKFEGLEDLYLNEIFYFYAPMNSRLKVANELRRNSGLNPITAAQLKDTLGNNGDTASAGQSIVSHTARLIINQYPTGLSDTELSQVTQTQNSVQSVRQAEYYVPRVSANTYREPDTEKSTSTSNGGTTSSESSTFRPTPSTSENSTSGTIIIPSTSSNTTSTPSVSEPVTPTPETTPPAVSEPTTPTTPATPSTSAEPTTPTAPASSAQ